MSNWPAAKASRVLAALLRSGWKIKRQSGSHRTLERAGWSDFVFAFHDNEEIGPRMLARICQAHRPGPSRSLSPTSLIDPGCLTDWRSPAAPLKILARYVKPSAAPTGAAPWEPGLFWEPRRPVSGPAMTMGHRNDENSGRFDAIDQAERVPTQPIVAGAVIVHRPRFRILLDRRDGGVYFVREP